MHKSSNGWDRRSLSGCYVNNAILRTLNILIIKHLKANSPKISKTILKINKL
jgi:hypothetical protein